MSRCRERAGVLFNRDCDQVALQSCATCKKPVCGRHARNHDGIINCVSCVRENLEERTRRGERPKGYEDDHYFYFYGYGHGWSSDPYDADDYDLFDAAPAAEEWGEESGWEGS